MLVAVALGANLGDRLGTLQGAVLALGRIGELLGISPLFETDPVGPEQPDYLNAAVLLRYDGSPRQLLNTVLAIERSFGRERRERWGPRTLDLDILWIDGVVVADPDLTIPHARLAERRFALEPLLAVAPDAAHPGSGEPYRACVDLLPAGGIRRIADADWAGGVQGDGKASETTRSAV